MSSLRELKQKLSTISRLKEEQGFDAALKEVESLLLIWPGNAHLHLLRANLIQLQDNPKYELDDAKQALQHAVELDKGSPAAAIELGYFLDNVEDDPQAAAKAYAEGVASARRLLIDGLIGQAKACRQMEKREEFLHCLLEILQLTQFDTSGKRSRADESGADALFEALMGRVYALQLKGPYADQIQELLNDLAADRPTGR